VKFAHAILRTDIIACLRDIDSVRQLAISDNTRLLPR